MLFVHKEYIYLLGGTDLIIQVGTDSLSFFVVYKLLIGSTVTIFSLMSFLVFSEIPNLC